MTESAPPTLPYANPTPLAAHGEIFRDGDLLIVRDGITLPARCLLCGAPASPNIITLKFSWDPSFKVSHAASTLQLRRAASFRAYLCPGHFSAWRTGRIIGIIGMITSALIMLASTVVAIISESADIPRYSPHALVALLVGFALFTIFLFLYTLKTRTLACTRIDAGYLYLQGAHEFFLAPLPSLPPSLDRKP
jgi:hypothetical protein